MWGVALGEGQVLAQSVLNFSLSVLWAERVVLADRRLPQAEPTFGGSR